jgi:hypothetical protein
MPEIVCRKCLRHNIIDSSHVTIDHRGWEWHFFIMSFFIIGIVFIYNKHIIIGSALMLYSYMIIIGSTKPRFKKEIIEKPDNYSLQYIG